MPGSYQPLRRLAVGGMAEIFLARAEGLGGFDKLVVQKRLLPQHESDDAFVSMILDEARLMATLSHPHIAQVYDVGVDAGRHFFTMEYVHGEDLREILRAAKGPLPLGEAVAIIAGAAAGLHHAHEARSADGAPLSIVHRDVSPSNVLVGYDGGVKVTDFGVAKWASQRSETKHGMLKGKVGYMSPEQCRAEPLDPRSDVFALGILLFEATTGRRPFEAESDFEIMNAIINKPPAAPSTIVPGYPAELEAIVLRALRRDRAERFATAEEMQLALESFAREQKLAISSSALARYMKGLFGGKVSAWERARDQGKTLGEHLREALPATVEETRTDVSVPAAARPLPPPDAIPNSAAVARTRSRVAFVVIGVFVVLVGAAGAAAMFRAEPVAGPSRPVPVRLADPSKPLPSTPPPVPSAKVVPSPIEAPTLPTDVGLSASPRPGGMRASLRGGSGTRGKVSVKPSPTPEPTATPRPSQAPEWKRDMATLPDNR